MNVNYRNTSFEHQANIIRYQKGVSPTHSLVPTSLELGKGASGIVYVHGSISRYVVKKSSSSLEREFIIGKSLNHPCIVTMHNLFIKEYGDRSKYKLVMDKIEGKKLIEIFDTFSNEALLK